MNCPSTQVDRTGEGLRAKRRALAAAVGSVKCMALEGVVLFDGSIEGYMLENGFPVMLHLVPLRFISSPGD